MSYPNGPRTTPTVVDGLVYTLGAEGDLFCFGTGGKKKWHRNFKEDFDVEAPLWGFSASPLVDGEQIICIVGGEGSVVVSFHRKTGEKLWSALSAKEPGYAPPMIYEVGGKRQLIVWHPEAINSLDPKTGKLYWSQPFAIQAGLTIPTPRLLGQSLFITSFYNGPMMLELAKDMPAAKIIWKGTGRNEKKTEQLHAIMATPFLEDGTIYGVCSYGQLRCLDLKTGKRIWESLDATGADKARWQRNRWANAFLVKHDDRFFIANEKGELILARLSRKGYEEISRQKILEPTGGAMGRKIVWSHPAYANRSVYMRNDKEIVCVSLAARAK